MWFRRMPDRVGCTHPDGESKGGSDVPLDRRLGLVLDDLHDGLLDRSPRRRHLRCRPLGAATTGRKAFVTLAAGELTLVTTHDCHFCERAHDVLATLAVQPREVSVYSSEAALLAERGRRGP